MDAIWVEKIIFMVMIASDFIYFRLNSPTCTETFKKFLEPILKDYEEADDSSLVTDISPSTS